MLDLEKRRGRISGSDVAPILGQDDLFGKTAFDVWAEKVGGFGDDAETLWRFIGHQFEEPLLRIYGFMTGREAVHLDVTTADPLREFMAYTPDGAVAGQRRGIDAKVVGYGQAHHWGPGPSAKDVPFRVQLQCAWYMAGCDYDAWDVIALIKGTPVIYTVERHREMEAAILQRAEEWWKRHIRDGVQPEITGSEAARCWLRRQFPKDTGDLMNPTAAQLLMFEEYARVRELLDDYGEERDILENKLKLSLGACPGLKLPGKARFTWKKAKDSETVIINWEAVARGLAHKLITAGYLTLDEWGTLMEIQTRTVTTPGSRRIYFRSGTGKVSQAA